MIKWFGSIMGLRDLLNHSSSTCSSKRQFGVKYETISKSMFVHSRILIDRDGCVKSTFIRFQNFQNDYF